MIGVDWRLLLLLLDASVKSGLSLFLAVHWVVDVGSIGLDRLDGCGSLVVLGAVIDRDRC